jgi:uncharacterized protein (TIGR03085 family)
MKPHSRVERAALADLLDELGPDAPTLCGDWNTADLAAHLVARDRRPDSTPGLVVPALGGWTEKVRRDVRAEHPYGELVDLIRGGPPVWSPVGLPFLESASNTVEYYIHHEDVRRAQQGWSPRALPSGLENTLWGRLRAGARLMLRGAPTGVTLVAPGGRRVVAKNDEPMVTLTAAPSELILYCAGRQAVARVDAAGDPDAVAALATAPLRI